MTDRILNIGQAGLETSDARVKSLMNNMVNAQTPGFKKTDAVISSFPSALQAAENKLAGKSVSSEPRIEGVYYNHQPGTLVRTGNSLDIAIGGDGYFVVSAPWGEGYTRDGRFMLDSEGKLITSVGSFPVLGQSGPIMVIPGSRVEVSGSGDVMVDGETVSRMRVVNFNKPQELQSVNNTIFRIPEGKDLGASEVEIPRVVQGYTEASNVNVIEEMMDLIYLQRTQGIDTKIISGREATLSRAIEMGRRD